MNGGIAYIKCRCKSQDRQLIKRLKAAGDVEIRITNTNPSFRTEALQYGLKLPIIVKDGVATRLEY